VETHAAYANTGHVRVALHEGELSTYAIAKRQEKVDLEKLGQDSSYIRPYHEGGWKLADGGMTTGLNADLSQQAEDPKFAVLSRFTDDKNVLFEKRLFIMWAEIRADVLSPLRQIYIRQYTTPTATTQKWVNLGNDFTNTVPDGAKYDLLNNAHSAHFATLENRLHLVHVDDTPYSPQIRTQVT
jgi:hypothetical protein